MIKIRGIKGTSLLMHLSNFVRRALKISRQSLEDFLVKVAAGKQNDPYRQQHQLDIQPE
jgi:hypothetical protein